MKSSLASLLVLASSTGTFAWGPGFGGGWGNWPSCANSCMSTFTSSSCAGDGSCFCKDTTALNNANTCIDSSSCSTSDKETIYQNIDQLCADVAVTVTAAPEATFSATSNSAWSGGPWSAAWGSGASGYGPFGGNWGPWGSSGAWTAGPWSAWWDGNACPPDSWTGWTSGTWSTGAPWTTWTACTASTTATSTFTTTSSGTVITGTSYGVKVAEQTGTTTSGAISTSTHAGAAASNAVKIGLSFVVVTFIVVVQG
ncbi:uncharacterized protein LY89DRAFT_667197 [Mollisia scopiformis]|uniref:CFEM domain-containing protein n=1 Tax=Mollisia scopiformis TaxID=149040 RepID=A0A194XHG0_MOLSC|nr:uncharacterized protein LY89DRAFT_667197 [Mollisia scopiformis]KUJ19207.1 hypothetical protein LY89DRAFT_667197 [Mollisia scopiformis]